MKTNILTLTLLLGCTPLAQNKDPGKGAIHAVTTESGETQEKTDMIPEKIVRIGIRARRPDKTHLTPLSYSGGFITKTLIYETLVKRDQHGKIVPALATSWRVLDEGRRYVFTIREDARFHDGSLVKAKDIVIHFRRWVGLPEHAWLRSSDHIKSVTVAAPSQVQIVLDKKIALLPDLCAINPCAIVGPGARNREGAFVKPVGTGTHEYVGVVRDGGAFRYRRVGTDRYVDLVAFERRDDDKPYEALVQGDLDAFVLGWSEYPDYAILEKISKQGKLELVSQRGSSLLYLSFATNSGPTRDAKVRHALAAAIDRQKLVDSVEKGHGEACTAWGAPALTFWPRSSGAQKPTAETPTTQNSIAPAGGLRKLRLLVKEGRTRDIAVAREVARQCAARGWEIRVLELADEAYRKALEEDDYDIRIERTWGSPYDPYLSLVSRFTPSDSKPSAASNRYFGVGTEITDLVKEAMACSDTTSRRKVYERIQGLIDRDLPILPLYVPMRLLVRRKGITTPKLGTDLYRIQID